MRKLISVDLDDTLADISHRRHFYESKQWDKYNSLIPLDTPIINSIEFVNSLYGSFYIIILTGRYECYREVTLSWLITNNVKFDELIMKPNDDERSSYYFKTEWIKINNDKLLAVFDDRDDIIEFCKNLNLITIKPNKI
jgi:FMN phosphatase YigB (HAD superfamily)